MCGFRLQLLLVLLQSGHAILQVDHSVWWAGFQYCLQMSLQSNFVVFSGCFSCISGQVRSSVLHLLLTSLFFSEYSLCACIFCCQVTAFSSFFFQMSSYVYFLPSIWCGPVLSFGTSSTQGVVACTYVCFLDHLSLSICCSLVGCSWSFWELWCSSEQRNCYLCSN